MRGVCQILPDEQADKTASQFLHDEQIQTTNHRCACKIECRATQSLVGTDEELWQGKKMAKYDTACYSPHNKCGRKK